MFNDVLPRKRFEDKKPWQYFIMFGSFFFVVVGFWHPEICVIAPRKKHKTHIHHAQPAT